jgi:hypothetical protein
LLDETKKEKKQLEKEKEGLMNEITGMKKLSAVYTEVEKSENKAKFATHIKSRSDLP